MVLFLTTGTMFSMLIATMVEACWSIKVVTKLDVNKILEKPLSMAKPKICKHYVTSEAADLKRNF